MTSLAEPMFGKRMFGKRVFGKRMFGKRGVKEKGSILVTNLNQLLVTTHGTEQILDNFFFETQSWLHSNGMSFENEHQNISYTVGVATNHRCSYKLYANHNYLGQLSFYRRYSFEEDELEIIEQLLSVLVSPLKQSLACDETYYL